jgi:RNA polymerase sigma-70 factor (family 1)
MEDNYIWYRIVDGDVEALRCLHDKYYLQMQAWAEQVLTNSAVADELVSDCFVKLWNKRGRIIIQKSLKAYLFLMLKNQIISYLRSAKAKKAEIAMENIPDFAEEESIHDQDLYSNLYRAIKKIPEQRRQILELAVFDSLTYKEIAVKLDISVNTVKTQIARSYKFLKEELLNHS